MGKHKVKYWSVEVNGIFVINLSDSKFFIFYFFPHSICFKIHLFLLFVHTVMKKDAPKLRNLHLTCFGRKLYIHLALLAYSLLQGSRTLKFRKTSPNTCPQNGDSSARWIFLYHGGEFSCTIGTRAKRIWRLKFIIWFHFSLAFLVWGYLNSKKLLGSTMAVENMLNIKVKWIKCVMKHVIWGETGHLTSAQSKRLSDSGERSSFFQELPSFLFPYDHNSILPLILQTSPVKPGKIPTPFASFSGSSANSEIAFAKIFFSHNQSIKPELNDKYWQDALLTWIWSSLS